MSQLNFHKKTTKVIPPPQRLLPILIKLKVVYILWQQYLTTFPKTSRYTIGNKIDMLLIEIIEAVNVAVFLDKQNKLPYIKLGIKKLDTTKIFIQISWEIKAVDTKKYMELSGKIFEIGKMLGGWHNQVIKQNSLDQ